MMETELKMLSLDEGRDAISRCNSHSRLPTIISIAYLMDADDWLQLLGESWQRCDNISQCRQELEDETPFDFLIQEPIEWRDRMMDDEERAALAALPDIVTIYRGCYANNKNGLSWTLRREVAERFPFHHRYTQEGQPLLIRATIARDQILALKLDRTEQEVIAWRPKIRAISHIRSRPALGSAS